MYNKLVDSEVMGITAAKQRSLNSDWNNTETVRFPWEDLEVNLPLQIMLRHITNTIKRL